MVSLVTNTLKAPGRRGLKPGQRHKGQLGVRPDTAAIQAKGTAARWSGERREFALACRELGPLMHERLHAIITAKKSSENAVLRAIEIAAAYGFGKPVSVVDVNVSHKPRPASELSDAEIRAFLGGASLNSPVLIEDQRGIRNVFDAEGRLLDFTPNESESVGAT